MTLIRATERVGEHYDYSRARPDRDYSRDRPHRAKRSSKDVSSKNNIKAGDSEPGINFISALFNKICSFFTAIFKGKDLDNRVEKVITTDPKISKEKNVAKKILTPHQEQNKKEKQLATIQNLLLLFSNPEKIENQFHHKAQSTKLAYIQKQLETSEYDTFIRKYEKIWKAQPKQTVNDYIRLALSEMLTANRH